MADGMGKLAVSDDRPAAPPVPAGKPVAQGPAHQPQEAPPLSRKRIVPPPRPGLGTSGRKLAVRANHFFVEVSVNDIFHYDVSSTRTHSFLNLVLRFAASLCSVRFLSVDIVLISVHDSFRFFLYSHLPGCRG